MLTVNTVINISISLICGGIAGGSIVMWLGNKWFERSGKAYQSKLDKELTAYKNELNNKAIEMKTQLDIKADRLSVEYKKLYLERLEVIKNIYSCILTIRNQYKLERRVISGGIVSPEVKDAFIGLSAALEEYTKYFEANKLFLSRRLCEYLSFVPQFITLESYSHFSEEEWAKIVSLGAPQKTVDKAKSLTNTFKGEFLSKFNFDDVIEMLENEFRDVIGVK
jgi:replicative superfamily II helicase